MTCTLNCNTNINGGRLQTKVLQTGDHLTRTILFCTASIIFALIVFYIRGIQPLMLHCGAVYQRAENLRNNLDFVLFKLKCFYNSVFIYVSFTGERSFVVFLCLMAIKYLFYCILSCTIIYAFLTFATRLLFFSFDHEEP